MNNPTSPTDNPNPPQPWGAQGPAGQWTFSGTTPTGEAYQGKLSLKRCGNIFEACWNSPELGELPGTGVLHDGLLLLARGKVDPRPGIVWYILATNGDLEGVWNSAGIKKQLSTGQAVDGEPGVLTGTRIITYYDPNGNPLGSPLRLQICEKESVFELDWQNLKTGVSEFTGVGLAIRNGLASAWDKAEDSLVLDLLVFKPDGTGGGTIAEASWARLGGCGLGTETMTR